MNDETPITEDALAAAGWEIEHIEGGHPSPTQIRLEIGERVELHLLKQTRTMWELFIFRNADKWEDTERLTLYVRSMQELNTIAHVLERNA